VAKPRAGLKPGAFFLDFNSRLARRQDRAAAHRQCGRRALCRRRGDDQRAALPHPGAAAAGRPDAATLLPLLQRLGFAPKLASERWAWPAPPRCAAA
jgi:hypothetical protein